MKRTGIASSTPSTTSNPGSGPASSASTWIWSINPSCSNRLRINLYSSVDEEHPATSTDYAASVGANSFAHNSLNVRMNSHLQTHQLRNLGLRHRLAYCGTIGHRKVPGLFQNQKVDSP